MPTTSFHAGDAVTWMSQANGSTKVKSGVVIRVLEPGESIRASVIFDLDETHNVASIKGAGFPRNHQSYLVSVPTTGRKAKPKVYWPVVSLLRPAPVSPHDGR